MREPLGACPRKRRCNIEKALKVDSQVENRNSFKEKGEQK